MSALMTPIKKAHEVCKTHFLDVIQRRIAQHENHARVTSSESAYGAACNLARAMREAKAHIDADDLDAVRGVLRYEVPLSECAETALREVLYK